jgi:hypothetical protein
MEVLPRPFIYQLLPLLTWKWRAGKELSCLHNTRTEEITIQFLVSHNPPLAPAAYAHMDVIR